MATQTAYKMVDASLTSPILPWGVARLTYSVGSSFDAVGLDGILPGTSTLITDPRNQYRGILANPSTAPLGEIRTYTLNPVDGSRTYGPNTARYLQLEYDDATDVLAVGSAQTAGGLVSGWLSLAHVDVVAEVFP